MFGALSVAPGGAHGDQCTHSGLVCVCLFIMAERWVMWIACAVALAVAAAAVEARASPADDIASTVDRVESTLGPFVSDDARVYELSPTVCDAGACIHR